MLAVPITKHPWRDFLWNKGTVNPNPYLRRVRKLLPVFEWQFLQLFKYPLAGFQKALVTVLALNTSYLPKVTQHIRGRDGSVPLNSGRPSFPGSLQPLHPQPR